jgi:hypothetical protein
MSMWDSAMGTTGNPEGAMRVQLQQQSGGRTIHHASIVLRAPSGVTLPEPVNALQQLRHSGSVPKGEEAGADFALANARRWADARPPAGVSGRFSKSFYFDPHRPRQSWRFDVEGPAGYNLRR